jgi:hypothetical protein
VTETANWNWKDNGVAPGQQRRTARVTEPEAVPETPLLFARDPYKFQDIPYSPYSRRICANMTPTLRSSFGMHEFHVLL